MVCISCQVGCNVGCRFCATGRLGRTRNLSVSEMLTQSLVGRDLLPVESMPASITFSGMGEPLQNLRAVCEAADRVVAEEGFSYASLSTVGIPLGIRRLAERRPATHLFVSLHAVHDEQRRSLIPSRSCFPIADILAAAEEYADRADRHVKLSYLLLPAINDSIEDARRLADLASNGPFVVLLLLWNDSGIEGFARADGASLATFRDVLEGAGVPVVVSVSNGQDVSGGCGQLAGRRGATSSIRTRLS